MNKLFPIFSGIFLIFFAFSSRAQLQSIRFGHDSLVTIRGIAVSGDGEISIPGGASLFSVLVDQMVMYPRLSLPVENDTLFFTLVNALHGWLVPIKGFSPGLKFTIHFINHDTISHAVENLVPLGEGGDKVYITAGGGKAWPHYLCRSRLYRNGFGPVGVILPDNAWHLGFADLQLSSHLSMTGLARRGERNRETTTVDRWAVTLKPGGWAGYALWFDIHSGDWHEGLKMMFQDRWLYDLDQFNDTLFHRRDLSWVRNTYIMLLQFAWDKKYYDYQQNKHTFYQNLFEYDSLTGGYDIFTLWPTWPRLGLDQRNQWDMYRDLPGGLDELKKEVDFCHQRNKKFFISFNPWDEGTRGEDQLSGMENLLRATTADGVVLDTRGASSKELQESADKVRPGIIMYSEGMAIPRDMPGIVSGRVHDALELPPPLNLNKLIKPDFAIFRVLQLADDRIHREVAMAFFNGYGVEINTMRPGRPDWVPEDFSYLGLTTKILRENTSVFHNDNFFPLVNTLTDSVYVNRWGTGIKQLYTILSLNPDGHDGPLFELDDLPPLLQQADSADLHAVDLWNHQEAKVIKKDGKTLVSIQIDPFDRAWLNTRKEGSVGCVAVFDRKLTLNATETKLTFSASSGDKIVVTGENPSYKSKSYIYPVTENTISYRDSFPATMQKIVVQLFDKNELTDEAVFTPEHLIPRLISRLDATDSTVMPPAGMVEIPSGMFKFYTLRNPGTPDPFIPFPDFSDTVDMLMPAFYMDRFPVTNKEYYEFIQKTGYRPNDTTNFLKHWVNQVPPVGMEDYPVVYVGPEDARAYAKWKGKRLPTAQEWQYSAQGNDMRKFPWGNRPDSTKCNYNLGHPTAVSRFPEGASPFGAEDLIGNVWQLTNDIYDNGAYCFTLIRGGSYFHPTQSVWYVAGGPLPADHPEMLLLISPGLNRNATVGFRCVQAAVD